MTVPTEPTLQQQPPSETPKTPQTETITPTETMIQSTSTSAPFQLPLTLKRGRGRPRKYPRIEHPDGRVEILSPRIKVISDGIPREEKGYQEIYKNQLDPSTPLPIRFLQEEMPVKQPTSLSIPEIKFKKIDKRIPRPASHVNHRRATDLSVVQRMQRDASEMVEYDMDEQDYFWLKRNPIMSEDQFEFLIDRLEKEWFDLTLPLRHWNQEKEQPMEDQPCDVCGLSESGNNDALVFCDGCNIAVHQECYGIPHIPEASWLCRKCMLNPGESVVRKKGVF